MKRREDLTSCSKAKTRKGFHPKTRNISPVKATEMVAGVVVVEEERWSYKLRINVKRETQTL